MSSQSLHQTAKRPAGLMQRSTQVQQGLVKVAHTRPCAIRNSPGILGVKLMARPALNLKQPTAFAGTRFVACYEQIRPAAGVILCCMALFQKIQLNTFQVGLHE